MSENEDDDWIEYECDDCGTILTKDEYESQNGQCNDCYWGEGDSIAKEKETST